MVDVSAVRRLASAVQKRMAEFTPPRSRRQVCLRGGLTEPTLRSILRADLREVMSPTLRKLNDGLDWEPGSAENVYQHGLPPTPRRSGGSMLPGPSSVSVGVEVITEVMNVTREIGEQSDALREACSHPAALASLEALQAAVGRLDRAIQPIYGTWATELLEANRRQGGALDAVLRALGPYLDRPIDPDDDDEEAEYRRWLIGMHRDLDPMMIRRFKARYSEANT